MKATEISIHINNDIILKGNLNIPFDHDAFVIFSHGSGSSRFSTRNRYVAEILNNNKIATLLTDLLTEKEDRIYQNRFDINLLTTRLIEVTNHAIHLPELKNFPVGYFGASTGAASALMAAAQIPSVIQAIVSRGGRPDLATTALPKVKSPTLLIVGGLDTDVISLNKDAYSELNCIKELRIVKGAGHLFEEPDKLDEVADLAVKWFNKHLVFNPMINPK
jgi:putative phosphoribosyl transferase